MRLRFVIATAAVLAAACSSAFADELFTLTSDNGKVHISFTLPASPTVTTGTDYFVVADVPVDINGTTTDDSLFFYNHADSGGLGIENEGTITDYLDQEGKRLYEGTLDDPTFSNGTFKLKNFPDSGAVYTNKFTLDITTAGTPPVPEPSSLVLLGTGLLGIMGVVRRRFAQGAGALRV